MKNFIALMMVVSLAACEKKQSRHDASGTFEAVETIVAAEVAGRIVSLEIEEGQQLVAGTQVGLIDPKPIALQKAVVLSTIDAIGEKTVDAAPQLQLINEQRGVQETQLAHLVQELQRTDRLVKADAATQKQLDDLKAQVVAARKELEVTRQRAAVHADNIQTQNRSILSERQPLGKKVEQLEDLEERSRVFNPLTGIVLTKYANQFEMTAAGKPLYKIADISYLLLRAYITGDQFAEVKLQQAVEIFVDNGKAEYKKLPGTIEWISDKAEFTPKTIQTKEERANLVYAVKIRVKNDGFLKIGMYGNVNFL